MAAASGDGEGPRRSVTLLVAYAVVLTLLGGAAVVFWTGGRRDLPGPTESDRTTPAIPKAAPVEPAPARQGLKLPPRPLAPEPTAPSQQEPAPQPAPEPRASSPPTQSEASPGAPPAEKPEPPKTPCTADIGPWPDVKVDQGRVIQILLHDLGFYSGTTYGTVGPTTRAAIRKFQIAVNEAETGEPSEALFESLKKKCALPVP